MNDPTPPENHITPPHYRAFGMIIHTFNKIDAILDGVIIKMIRGDLEMTRILLTFLVAKDKRDYILAIAKQSNLPQIAITELEGLLDRLKSVTDLRNSVAHCAWIAGRKSGTIKPLVLSARVTLKIRGLEYNEDEWTADQLLTEVDKSRELLGDLAAFAERYGLYLD